MELFPNEAALEESGYLFRIVDNGGETYDRLTVTFCDGDSLLCTLGSICAHVESDRGLQADSEAVEDGTARDLRWIDLDAGLRKRILADLNDGFADYIANAPAAATRDDARDWQGLWNDYCDDRTPIYRDGDAFRIRDDERRDDDGDPGPFATFRDAVFYMLPRDYDLSGPEYHSTVDLWDTTGGPAEPWDREADPPHPYEVALIREDGQTSEDNPHWQTIGEARDHDHAREIARAWQAENPDRAGLYRVTIGGKADRTFHNLNL
jgi:hypothetical protein